MDVVESSPMSPTFDQLVVTVVTAAVSLVGVVVNVVCSMALLRLKVFNSSFGILSACETLANAAILLVFLIWCAPTTILGIPDEWQTVNRRLGQLTIFLQGVSFHSILFLSINRMMAIVFPISYRQYFTNKMTLWVVCVIIAISLAIASIQFIDDCYLFYSAADYDWDYAKTECGKILAWYLNVLYNMTLFVVVAIIDFITLMKLRMNRKVLNPNPQALSLSSQEESQKKRRKEIKFFTQSCITSFVFALSLILFLKLEHLLETEDLAVYFSTNFIWQLAHLLGGLILILFNTEIRQSFIHPSILWKKAKYGTSSFIRTTTVAQNQN